ncbi:MAG: universal stress protein [Pseudomonadota bacterium]
MKHINKVMVCIDLSEYSKANLEYALELAGNSGAEIVVQNVINQRDINAVEMVACYYPDKINLERYIETTKKERMESLRRLVMENFFDQKSGMNFRVDAGYPFEEILKAIDEEKADIVVMGNKGRGNLSRTLFGSAAEKVFRHSPVPVVSVRDRQKFKRN